MDQLRYLSGPLPMSICYIKILIGTAAFQQILMLSTAIVLTKYIFTFYLKNPLAIEEGFWSRFISSWIFLVSSLCQIVFFMLPGIVTQ
jgi:hypothetical protein